MLLITDILPLQKAFCSDKIWNFERTHLSSSCQVKLLVTAQNIMLIENTYMLLHSSSAYLNVRQFCCPALSQLADLVFQFSWPLINA